jgi:molybdopterin biosynthesis enzyme
LQGANALLAVSEKVEKLEAGDVVEVLLLRGMT